MNLIASCSDFSRFQNLRMLDHFSRHFYILDQKGNLLYCNDICHGFLDSEGYLDIFNQFNTYDLIPAKEAALIKQNNTEVLKTQKELVFQETFTYKDNETKTALTIKTPFRNSRKKLQGIIGISFIKEHKSDAGKQLLLRKLTPKKIDCLYYLVKGYSYKNIAYKMNLSPRTIEHYIEGLYDKYNCTKRHELVSQALKIEEIQLRLFSDW